MIGLKGKVRQLYGWSIIILSDIALAAVTIFEMKRLFITEAEQQPLVNGLMYAIDFGLGMLLVILAVVMVWRLIDLFKNKGTLDRRSGPGTLAGGEQMKQHVIARSASSTLQSLPRMTVIHMASCAPWI